MKKLLTGIRKNAMLIHTYIHTYRKEDLYSQLPKREKRWDSYLTISSLLGGCYGN